MSQKSKNKKQKTQKEGVRRGGGKGSKQYLLVVILLALNCMEESLTLMNGGIDTDISGELEKIWGAITFKQMCCWILRDASGKILLEKEGDSWGLPSSLWQEKSEEEESLRRRGMTLYKGSSWVGSYNERREFGTITEIRTGEFDKGEEWAEQDLFEMSQIGDYEISDRILKSAAGKVVHVSEWVGKVIASEDKPQFYKTKDQNYYDIGHLVQTEKGMALTIKGILRTGEAYRQDLDVLSYA